MTKLNLSLLLLLLLTFTYKGKTQPNLPPNIADSLLAIWNDPSKPDTLRLKAMNKYAWIGYLYSQPDSAYYYAQIEYDYAKSKNLKLQMSNALNTQGVAFYFKGEYAQAIEVYNKCLILRKEVGDKKGIASSLNNIGMIYSDQGNYANAIDYFTQSLKIFEEIGDKSYAANALGNIGNVYAAQSENANAIDYYTRSLKIKEEIGDKKAVAFALNNIGMIYEIENKYDKAIDYFNQSIKIKEEINDEKGIAMSLNNLGNVYKNQRDYSKAFDHYTQSLKIREKIGDKQGISSTLNNLGDLYKEQGNYPQALYYCNQAHKIAKEVGVVTGIKNTSLSLWEINKKLGKYKDALEMHELYISIKDSIESEENQKEIIRQELQYNYDKKAATDSIANEKEKEIKDIEIVKQKAEIQAKRNQQYLLFGGLALVFIFALFMYNRFKITKKQKVIIEEKEKETSLQKHIIEEKHKEITDSINYAERIQRSFLATKELLDENLKEYFVLFLPKDVVSGDFYWASKLKNNHFAFCCADSTGHGVPGAIMSILNISSLEKSIEKETEPNIILTETRKIIIERLKKDGSSEGGKDGMDCSLLVLNQEKTQVTFASANNPVFIIRNGEIMEFKGDKMPVGKHDNDHEAFTLQTIQLQKKDVIYTLTDGFSDQFGGQNGKKYMIKNLKEILLKIAHLSMAEQNQKLLKEFNTWKGENEQVDDVCIIGVRL